VFAMLVTAIVLVVYPASVSVGSSLPGLERTSGHPSHVADAAASTTKPDTAHMPCAGMPDCNMFDGHGSGPGNNVGSNDGECCSGFCALAMGLAGSADIGLPIRPESHFLHPQRVVLTGEWAAPLRPPNG